MNSFRIGPTTSRMVFRKMDVDDAESFLKLNGDPRVMRYTHEPLLTSLDEARERILAYPDFDSVGYGRWGCFLNSSGEMVGFCGLKYLEDLNQVDVGYRFLPQYWGIGLATEAARASIQFGMETLELQRIIGLVLPQNAGSIRVLQKSGLIFERTIFEEGLEIQQFVITAQRYQAIGGAKFDMVDGLS